MLTPRTFMVGMGEVSPSLDFDLELWNVRQRERDFVQHALRTLVEIFGAPAFLGARARLDVGAEAPRARDAAPAELAAQAIVAGEGAEQIFFFAQGVGKA